MPFYKATYAAAPTTTKPPNGATNGGRPANTLSDKLTATNRGEYSHYAAQTLSVFAGWSYSDYETFKDVLANHVAGSDIMETAMIQVKNEPLLVQATAQIARTTDKKVAIVTFRGTEMTNLVNWTTDAVAKKTDFYDYRRHPKGKGGREARQKIQVHKGFLDNFDSVWSGEKGILMHLLHPERMCKDYDYEKTREEQRIPDEQDELEAIYICGHSLGGAMAFLAGLNLACWAEKGKTPEGNPVKTVFRKLRGVYTYGAPMVIDDHDWARCNDLCGSLTFRHVYYNDIVPHLPPLSTGSFDHVGTEYRFHPRQGWKKRTDDSSIIPFKSDRCTQVVSIAATAPAGILDAVLDNINWLNFVRGDDWNIPVIGLLSRGYLKMPWSIGDHSPIGYISSLALADNVSPQGN